MNKTLSLILAYVGILTGAGLASGQELLQYFISFGFSGLIGLLIVGILHFIFGGAILELGSFYQADSHIDVLDELTHPIVKKFLDYALVFTCFVFGFVMIAAAGSNLNQEFQIPNYLGSLFITFLIILIGMMDFEKVTKIIGAFTPLILIFVLLANIYTFVNSNYAFNSLDSISKTLTPNTINPFVASINYFSMCIMSAVSMAFVLGGSRLDSKKAKFCGRIGGFLVGLLGFLIGFILFLNIETVKDSDIPMQIIIKQIHPILGRLMSVVIFGMIFNTAISLFYSMAVRFSSNEKKKFRFYLIFTSILAYAVSFLGFKKLLAIFYPLIGYVGIILLLVLIYGFFSQKEEMMIENKRRFRILKLLRRKIDKNLRFTHGDNRKLQKHLEASVLDNKKIKELATERIKEIFEEEKNR